MHRLQLTLRTALLVENQQSLEENLQRLSFRPIIYSPDYKLVNAALVQACHRQKLLIILWTVNTTADAAQLAQPLDGLITDYPDLLTAK